ncbi:unnamed protein product [Enterobius vermicularis]|uniref:SYBU n=1 Tax=Enterobius vermicularis TaxID=51028 RepID=A0A0N4UTK6_ENTVE|nr:unnamed protein product [Enterobius vermicularis]
MPEKLSEDESISLVSTKYGQPSKDSRIRHSVSVSPPPYDRSQRHSSSYGKSHEPVSERRLLRARRFGIEPHLEELSVC